MDPHSHAEAPTSPTGSRRHFRQRDDGHWEYTVGAWVDPFATWQDELRRKVEAGETEFSVELAEGELIAGVELATSTRRSTAGGGTDGEGIAGRPLTVEVEPVLAAFGAWYELFPARSAG